MAMETSAPQLNAVDFKRKTHMQTNVFLSLKRFGGCLQSANKSRLPLLEPGIMPEVLMIPCYKLFRGLSVFAWGNPPKGGFLLGSKKSAKRKRGGSVKKKKTSRPDMSRPCWVAFPSLWLVCGFRLSLWFPSPWKSGAPSATLVWRLSGFGSQPPPFF